MDFANADIPKSVRTTSLSWDLISFMDEDFFPVSQQTSLKLWNGSEYTTVVLKRYNGTSWQDCSLKVFRNSVWE